MKEPSVGQLSGTYYAHGPPWGQHAYSFDVRYRGTAFVEMHAGEPPPGLEAYDAREVVGHLGPEIERAANRPD